MLAETSLAKSCLRRWSTPPPLPGDEFALLCLFSLPCVTFVIRNVPETGNRLDRRRVYHVSSSWCSCWGGLCQWMDFVCGANTRSLNVRRLCHDAASATRNKVTYVNSCDWSNLRKCRMNWTKLRDRAEFTETGWICVNRCDSSIVTSCRDWLCMNCWTYNVTANL